MMRGQIRARQPYDNPIIKKHWRRVSKYPILFDEHHLAWKVSKHTGAIIGMIMAALAITMATTSLLRIGSYDLFLVGFFLGLAILVLLSGDIGKWLESRAITAVLKGMSREEKEALKDDLRAFKNSAFIKAIKKKNPISAENLELNLNTNIERLNSREFVNKAAAVKYIFGSSSLSLSASLQ